jgi:hypothetical protein
MPLTLNSLTMDEVQAVIDTLETDVAALQTEDAVLGRNVRTVVSVDMNNDDYTLTLDEANSALLVMTNVGDGTKTLTWPTTSDNTRPAQQLVVTLLASDSFSGSAESGGGTAEFVNGTIHIVSVPDGLGVFNVDQYIQDESRKSSNGIVTLAVGNTNTSDSNAGKLHIGSDGAAQTLTIIAASNVPNMIVPVYCNAAGGVTIQNGLGVTVTGNTVLANGDRCTIYRDGSTETYYCV